LRPRPRLRAARAVRALSLTIASIMSVAALAVPAAAASGTGGTAPSASIARVAVGWHHLNVRAGHRAIVRGRALPRRRGVRALLQVRGRRHWRTLDRDRTGVRGIYKLHRRVHRAMSARARVVLRAHDRRLHRRVGRLNVYRWANASWYGPGLYGNHLACGGHLGYGTLGVANKSLPCGARLTLRHRGHVLRVGVIDRGPYVAGREFDLTEATARRLHFHGHGPLQVTR
jgi:rare lipoprotein A